MSPDRDRRAGRGSPRRRMPKGHRRGRDRSRDAGGRSAPLRTQRRGGGAIPGRQWIGRRLSRQGGRHPTSFGGPGQRLLSPRRRPRRHRLTTQQLSTRFRSVLHALISGHGHGGGQPHVAVSWTWLHRLGQGAEIPGRAPDAWARGVGRRGNQSGRVNPAPPIIGSGTDGAPAQRARSPANCRRTSQLTAMPGSRRSQLLRRVSSSRSRFLEANWNHARQECPAEGLDGLIEFANVDDARLALGPVTACHAAVGVAHQSLLHLVAVPRAR